jgi:hypothetical protein
MMLSVGELDFPRRSDLDVGAEFQPHSELDSKQLSDFNNSVGRNNTRRLFA